MVGVGVWGGGVAGSGPNCLKPFNRRVRRSAEMFEEVRIICHYPSSHRLPVPVGIVCQSRRTGLRNTLLDPLLTRLQSSTFQPPESGQSRTHEKRATPKQNKKTKNLVLICPRLTPPPPSLRPPPPVTTQVARKALRALKTAGLKNIWLYDLASAKSSFGTSTLISPCRRSAC